MSEENPKRFRDHVFTFLFTALSIVLAGFGTTLIARHYQQKDETIKAFATARDSANQTYREVVKALGLRYYFAMRAAIGFQYKTEEAERWKMYEEQVIEWNKNLFVMRSAVRRYFGEDIENQILGYVKKFSSIHQKLLAAKNQWKANKPVGDLDLLLQKEIWPLDNDISTFSNQLEEQLREGKVDIYRPVPPLKNPEANPQDGK